MTTLTGSRRRPSRKLGLGLIALAAVLAQAPSAALALTSAACPVLLVVEKGDASVAAFDVASGKTLWRAPAGSDPHEVAVASDGSKAFVSNYGGPGSELHTLTTVSLPDGKPGAPVDLGYLRSPHGMIVRDGLLWFTAETNKVIGRYDIASGKIQWVMGTAQDRTHLLAFGAGGSFVTSNVNSSTLSVIEPADITFANTPRKEWRVTSIATGDGTQGFDLTPDLKFAWTMAVRDGAVAVVDLATKQVVGKIAIPWKAGNRLKISPDGKLALVTSDQLVAIDTATRQFKTVQLGASRGEGILVTSDSRQAFVALPTEGKVAIVSLPDLKVEGYLPTGKTPDGLACAPVKAR